MCILGNVYLPLLRPSRNEIEPERLNEMTQQISQMFPHIPIESIQNDLRQTHSVELTIENILQDRLGTSTNNNSSRNNLLNLNDYSDEEDDEDDLTSSDDDNNHNLINDSTSTRNNNSENLLRRRNIFS